MLKQENAVNLGSYTIILLPKYYCNSYINMYNL